MIFNLSIENVNIMIQMFKKLILLRVKHINEELIMFLYMIKLI